MRRCIFAAQILILRSLRIMVWVASCTLTLQVRSEDMLIFWFIDYWLRRLMWNRFLIQ